MSTVFAHGLLIAQSSRVDEMARRLADGFREEPVRFEGGVWWLAIVTVVVLLPAVWVLGRLMGRWPGHATWSSPGRLFASLCRAHGLGRRDRWLLRRLAAFQSLSDPARLFLEPERFHPHGLGPTLSQWGTQLQAIRSRLFAALREDDSAPPQRADSTAQTIAAATAPVGQESMPGSTAISTTTMP